MTAKSFAPTSRAGGKPPRWIPVRDLILPDNSQPAGLPVLFEGRLRHFQRQIGVVVVGLESPASPNRTTEGPVFLRGTTAVILRGPAVVGLAFPFQVERLPANAENYWRDLRVPRAQFEFPFSGGWGHHEGQAPRCGQPRRDAPPVEPRLRFNPCVPQKGVWLRLTNGIESR